MHYVVLSRAAPRHSALFYLITTPSFDQVAVDRRFLEEVYRLHAAKAFTTFTELAKVLQTHRGIIAEIEVGRYHCNLKLLYLLHTTYQVDVEQSKQARRRPRAPSSTQAGLPSTRLCSQIARTRSNIPSRQIKYWRFY